FDAIVLSHFMSTIAGFDSTVDKLIERYLLSYPDEESGQLKADIYTAARVSAPIIETLQDLYTGRDETARRRFAFGALEQVMARLKSHANAKRTLFQRIFRGTRLNYETQPQRDRINTSRSNIAKAAAEVGTGWH